MTPRIFEEKGWLAHFYSNERSEPVHVHCDKGEKECKFWIDSELYEVRLAYSFNMNSKDIREVRKILFEHFDIIESAWRTFFEEKG